MSAENQTKTHSLVALSDTAHGKFSLSDRFIADENQLRLSSGRDDVTCMVKYLGYWFAIHSEQKETESHIRIHAILGNLPFSYVSPFARNNIQAVVREAGRQLGGRVFFDKKQRIIFAERIRTKSVLTPELIVTEATKVMLRLKPYLELVNILQPAPYVETQKEIEALSEEIESYSEEDGISNT